MTMTEEAKRAVEHLRGNAEFQWCSDCYVGDGCGDAYHSNCHFLRIADLIESLSAELEQVKRERDAAVEDLKGLCDVCAHRVTCDGPWCGDCDEFNGCTSPCNNWQWRGVKEE